MTKKKSDFRNAAVVRTFSITRDINMILNELRKQDLIISVSEFVRHAIKDAIIRKFEMLETVEEFTETPISAEIPDEILKYVKNVSQKWKQDRNVR